MNQTVVRDSTKKNPLKRGGEHRESLGEKKEWWRGGEVARLILLEEFDGERSEGEVCLG